MTKWQATFPGLKHLPRDLSGFEIEAFFTFTVTVRFWPHSSPRSP
jgi:hypothetical protein